jgi:NTE family protein
MTTAWVLPGGATMGAIQAGQAEALMRAGAVPDLVIGASAGALNAAWIAADPTVHGVGVLQDLWVTMRRRDVLPVSAVTLGRAVTGRSDHTVSSRRLERWLERHLPYRRIEEGRLPLVVTATDLSTGTAVLLSRGALIPALLASCALPGVFPPVADGERLLVDGGLVADAPIVEAVARGADRIFVLPTLAAGPAGRPRGAVELVLRSVGLLLGATRAAAMDTWADRCEIYVVPVPGRPGTSPLSLKHSAELIDAARAVTAAWLPSARPAPVPATVRLGGRTGVDGHLA